MLTSYPELEKLSELSCTFYGHPTYWTPDWFLDLAGEEWQVQTKGTDFLFKRLEESLKGATIHSPLLYQKERKQFIHLHKTVVDLLLRDLTNSASVTLCTDRKVRPILYISLRSLRYWEQTGISALDEKALLSLYKKESASFLTHWKKFCSVIFPQSFSVLESTQKLSLELKSGPEVAIIHKFIDCLERAKTLSGFDDSFLALYERWKSWRQKVCYYKTGKNAGHLIIDRIPGLPKRFRATTTKSLRFLA